MHWVKVVTSSKKSTIRQPKREPSSLLVDLAEVVLVAMIACSVILWGFGVGPVYTS